MSWIIGYVGQHLAPRRRDRIAALAADPTIERKGRTFYVAAGGLAETCAGGDLPENGASWCVVGTGVRLEADESRPLTASDWRRRLMSQTPRLDRLGGGFVAARWRSRRLEAFSDVVGVRSLYWVRVDNGYLFSTRPDWLASTQDGLRVNWEAFGSHWLAYNQLSHRSLIHGVERLGPGGYVLLTDDAARATSSPYVPREGAPTQTPAALLSTQLKTPDDRSVSLGLSGGIDSRTLLALRPRKDSFGVHVFGRRTREDVRIALSIAEEERLAFSHFHVPPVDRDELLRVVAEHAVQAQAVSPASASLSLRYYPELRSQRKLVVDGGFGEIMRRQFMNRLLRRGSKAVRGRNGRAALNYIRFERMLHFDGSLRRRLEEGAVKDMDLLLEEAAAWLDLGLENAVDLMNVRTRLPNFFGYEQARLDALVQNFMPFAHPRFLDSVFGVAVRRRRRSRLSRRIIASHEPRLRRYPLVKGDIPYPYGLPSLLSAAYVKFSKRYGHFVEPPDRKLVLHQLKEFVMDRIGSSPVQSDEAYDPAALRALAEGYYRNGTNGAQLDWWLALDLWRRAIEQPAKHPNAGRGGV